MPTAVPLRTTGTASLTKRNDPSGPSIVSRFPIQTPRSIAVATALWDSGSMDDDCRAGSLLATARVFCSGRLRSRTDSQCGSAATTRRSSRKKASGASVGVACARACMAFRSAAT